MSARPKTPSAPGLSCSFCGKGVLEVRKFIAGPDVYICNECICLCAAMLANDFGKQHIAHAAAAPARLKELVELGMRLSRIAESVRRACDDSERLFAEWSAAIDAPARKSAATETTPELEATP